MKSPARFIAIILFVCNLLLGVCPVDASAKKISESEAVKIAQQFIADNGYTKATPAVQVLAPESFNQMHDHAFDFFLDNEFKHLRDAKSQKSGN